MTLSLVLGSDYSFDPDEIAILASAYENALRELRLINREDPPTLTVAHRIIDLAKQGERNPARLCDAAVKSLMLQPLTK
jgi:hypothetical protein